MSNITATILTNVYNDGYQMTRKFPYLFLVLYFVFVNGMMPADAHTNGNIDVKHGTAHPIGSYYYDRESREL